MRAHRLRVVHIAAIFALTGLAGACGSRSPVSPSPGKVAIMGPARLTSGQLVSWFRSRQPQPAGAYDASVPVETLAQYFLDEGAAEGVTGDVAFLQSIVETGWFRFTGTVASWMNNFAGIGAGDGSSMPPSFPDARTGVRAQIQHLRAYADPAAASCRVPPLRHPCVDPRFDLVVPKGRAPTWNQLGNGHWATSAGYGTSILSLYQEALLFHGLR